MIFKILLSVLQYVTLSLYSDMFSIFHNEPDRRGLQAGVYWERCRIRTLGLKPQLRSLSSLAKETFCHDIFLILY